MSIATAAGMHQPDADHIAVCREALEVLSVCLALCPQALEVLNKEKPWKTFITDLLLLSSSRYVRLRHAYVSHFRHQVILIFLLLSISVKSLIDTDITHLFCV